MWTAWLWQHLIVYIVDSRYHLLTIFFWQHLAPPHITNTTEERSLTALLIRGSIYLASPQAFPILAPYLSTETGRHTHILLHSVAELLFSCVGEGSRLRDTIECLRVFFLLSFLIKLEKLYRMIEESCCCCCCLSHNEIACWYPNQLHNWFIVFQRIQISQKITVVTVLPNKSSFPLLPLAFLSLLPPSRGICYNSVVL